MAALPNSSTVIVHAIIDGKHSAMVYPEVNIETSVDISNCTPFQTPTYGQTKYIITGSAGACWVEGGDVGEVDAEIIAFQSERAARLRKERDEARRELSDLKARLRGVFDPPEPEGDHCHWCGGFCVEE